MRLAASLALTRKKRRSKNCWACDPRRTADTRLHQVSTNRNCRTSRASGGLTGCAKTAESWPYAIGRGTGERKRTDHLDTSLICGPPDASMDPWRCLPHTRGLRTLNHGVEMAK